MPNDRACLSFFVLTAIGEEHDLYRAGSVVPANNDGIASDHKVLPGTQDDNVATCSISKATYSHKCFVSLSSVGDHPVIKSLARITRVFISSVYRTCRLTAAGTHQLKTDAVKVFFLRAYLTLAWLDQEIS